MNSTKSRKNPVLRQFFKLMFLSGAIFIVALSVILLLVAWVQRDYIMDQFSHHLQHRLNIDVQVDALEFGVIRSFPMASLTATGVTLQSGQPSDSVFLYADANSIQLHFNILDIFRKEYHVQRLIIKNGNITTTFDPDIFQMEQPGNQNVRNNTFHFDLRRLHLYEMEVNYITTENQHFQNILIHELHLSGSFREGSTWTVAKSSILYKDHLLKVSGEFLPSHDGLLVDVTLRGNNFRIESILNEFPNEISGLLSPYNPRGNIDFSSHIAGDIGINKTPLITADFNIDKGSFDHPDKNLMIGNISLKGHYTNGINKTQETSAITLNGLRAKTESGNIRGNVSIENLHQPGLEIDLFAEISATEFLGWTGINTINVKKGAIKADLFFSGKINSQTGISGSDLLSSNFQGSLQFHDLSFSTKDNPLSYHGFSGTFQLAKDHILIIEKLSGKMGQSDIALTGTVYNLLPFMFIPQEVLYVEAFMASEKLLLDEILMANGRNGGNNGYRLSFPKHLNLSLNASVGNLKFRRFSATNIQAETTLVDRQLYAEKLAFNTMDGSALMTGSIDTGHAGEIRLHTNAALKNVDIHQLFYQTGNFGQTSIVDENIFGRVTANIDFFSLWTQELRIRWETMATSASLIVENGELVNYQPMQALGRYIRAGDLSNVAFSTLKNEIYIRDKMIFIPMMEIHSNVLNLELSGEHSFGNEIDYRLRVELSELLSRRHRESRNPQDQFGEIIDDGLGRTTLFLKLTGTTHDVAVRYDQEGLKDKLRQDIREERENLRDILRDEFRFISRQPPDTTSHKDDRQKERERIRKQEEEGFIIEWD